MALSLLCRGNVLVDWEVDSGQGNHDKEEYFDCKDMLYHLRLKNKWKKMTPQQDNHPKYSSKLWQNKLNLKIGKNILEIMTGGPRPTEFSLFLLIWGEIG